MGASGWSYFVPYQTDVNKALQELRQQLFEKGDYYKFWEEMGEEENPQSIEELIELAATEGTHTIIDMEGAYLEPLAEGEPAELAVIYPLSAEALLEIFETDRPTRDMIVAIDNGDAGVLYEQVPGSQTGIYITYYQGETPDGYFFCGISGD